MSLESKSDNLLGEHCLHFTLSQWILKLHAVCSLPVLKLISVFLMTAALTHRTCAESLQVARTGTHLDHGGPWVLLGGLNGAAQANKVGVTVLDMLHMPAQGLKARGHILCEGDLCVSVNGDPAAL